MAAGEQGSTYDYQMAFFADLVGRLCSCTCVFDFSLLRCASVLYALQSLSACI